MKFGVPRHYPSWVSDVDRRRIERRIERLNRLRPSPRGAVVMGAGAVAHLVAVVVLAAHGEVGGAFCVAVDAALWTCIAAIAALGFLHFGAMSTARARGHGLLLRALRGGGVVRPEEDYPLLAWHTDRSLAAELGLVIRDGYYLDADQAEPAIAKARERLTSELANAFWLSPERVAQLRSYGPMAYVVDELVQAGRLVWTDDGLAIVGSTYRH